MCLYVFFCDMFEFPTLDGCVRRACANNIIKSVWVCASHKLFMLRTLKEKKSPGNHAHKEHASAYTTLNNNNNTFIIRFCLFEMGLSSALTCPGQTWTRTHSCAFPIGFFFIFFRILRCLRAPFHFFLHFLWVPSPFSLSKKKNKYFISIIIRRFYTASNWLRHSFALNFVFFFFTIFRWYLLGVRVAFVPDQHHHQQWSEQRKEYK